MIDRRKRSTPRYPDRRRAATEQIDNSALTAVSVAILASSTLNSSSDSPPSSPPDSDYSGGGGSYGGGGASGSFE